ncbi:DUF6300 family protein [Streptomyces coeruleorubidus]|uniref:DUF6300 family protein n=1 Tax=Streptomyces coeruleorubidus TaxID=116188 RepID=UPI0037B38576
MVDRRASTRRAGWAPRPSYAPLHAQAAARPHQQAQGIASSGYLRPISDRDERPLRPCSRCGGDLLLQWTGPWGTGVWMELCPACDADRPAAGAFIRWHRNPDRDPKALPKLFEDCETETMHAHGWSRAAQPRRLLARRPRAFA